MSENYVNLIGHLYALFAEGDVPAVLAGLYPEIEWNEAENFPCSVGNPYIGPEAVLLGVFSRLGVEWDFWKLKIDEILDAGDTVVALGRYRAKHTATGNQIDAQFAHVWKVRDGKAVNLQQYSDTFQFVNALAGA